LSASQLDRNMIYSMLDSSRNSENNTKAATI